MKTKQKSGRFIIRTRASICLAVLICSAFIPTAGADPVCGNYLANTGYDPNSGTSINRGCGITPERDQAMAFSVPPGIDYTLDEIDLTLQLVNCTSPLKVELWSDNGGVPGIVIDSTLTLITVPTGAPATYVATSTLHPTLVQNGKYWVVASITPNGDAKVDWSRNCTGVVGPHANRFPPSSTWNLVNSSAVQAAFRIVGSPVVPDAIKPSYSSYATLVTGPCPATGGAVTVPDLHIEVFCPGNPPTLQFYCSLNLTIQAGLSSAEICNRLRDAINNDLSCQGLGFEADCCGNILRLRNTRTDQCPGAFCCLDPLGLQQFAKSLPYEFLFVTGALRLWLDQTASGIAEDPNDNYAVRVVHTVRGTNQMGPFSQGFEVALPLSLSAGMSASDVAAWTYTELLNGGDTYVSYTSGDNKVFFNPPPGPGSYDVAFEINDKGLQFAMTPPMDQNPFEIFAPQPRLDISLHRNAQAQITWATNFSGYVLEATDNLPTMAWNPVGTNGTIAGAHYSVTVNTEGAQRFFRLRKP